MKTNRKSRRGAVTVEMAIAAPILFLMVFAALEFCGANVQRHTVDNAAYEAARRGIVPGATVADVEARAQEIMGFVGASGVTVDVTPTVISDATPEITVRVSSPIANGWITSHGLWCVGHAGWRVYDASGRTAVARLKSGDLAVGDSRAPRRSNYFSGR